MQSVGDVTITPRPCRTAWAEMLRRVAIAIRTNVRIWGYSYPQRVLPAHARLSLAHGAKTVVPIGI